MATCRLAAAVGLLVFFMACTLPSGLPGHLDDPTLGSGEMVINSPVEQARRNVLEVFHVVLEPPPAKPGSHLTAVQAIDASRKEGYGENEGASAVTPRLALYTGGTRQIAGNLCTEICSSGSCATRACAFPTQVRPDQIG
jgi:hypothetical protein